MDAAKFFRSRCCESFLYLAVWVFVFVQDGVGEFTQHGDSGRGDVVVAGTFGEAGGFHLALDDPSLEVLAGIFAGKPATGPGVEAGYGVPAFPVTSRGGYG